MMSRTPLLLLIGSGAVVAAGLYFSGLDPSRAIAKLQDKRDAATKANRPLMAAPAVTVTTVSTAEFAETVLVTGSLIAREEILVAPEIDGFRVLSLNVEEGDFVKQGDVLALIEHETIDAQLSQNTAQIARATAAIAQAQSQIAQAEARLKEAKSSFDRAKPLKQSGYLSESTLDQRESASRTAEAQLVAARDGLKLAEAEKQSVEAQRRELTFRRARTDIKAPAAGVVSRRNARVGGMATASAEPMFRIIANGEFELDAEVTESRLAKVVAGQAARIDVTGAGEVKGQVRLVSPEVDRLTRLGRVRIFLGRNPALKLGLFARGTIETQRSRGLAAPASAILYSPEGASVQVVVNGVVQTRRIETGLVAGGLVEVRSGIADGDVIVTRAGSFLRDGDIVRPVRAEQKLSEAAK